MVYPLFTHKENDMPYKHKRDKQAHARAYWLKHKGVRQTARPEPKERVVPDTRSISERINEAYIAYVGDMT